MPRRPTLNPEWAAPSVWALPQVLMGQARTRGAAPNLSEAERRGIASPHIGRRSRSRQPLNHFSCKQDLGFIREFLLQRPPIDLLLETLKTYLAESSAHR